KKNRLTPKKIMLMMNTPCRSSGRTPKKKNPTQRATLHGVLPLKGGLSLHGRRSGNGLNRTIVGTNMKHKNKRSILKHSNLAILTGKNSLKYSKMKKQIKGDEL
ncbi:MAG: hypothetical protein RQ743_14670, partial [Bacteroidales bacterium]|nr:hypothetical protein [Bacteroidales bacterium]